MRPMLPCLALGAALILSPVANARPGTRIPEAQGGRPVPTNDRGLPVLDGERRPLVYSKSQMDARPRLDTRSRGEAATPLAFDPTADRWYAAFGSGIGKSNILMADNGGQFYMAGSTSTFGPDDYWYALAYQPASGGYAQVFVSPSLGNGLTGGIARMEIGDVDPSPGQEILVALDDGRIEIYAASDKRWLREIVTAATDLEGLALADVTGDARSEIVVCTATGLFVYSADGALAWQLPGVGGHDVVVAQMDGDPPLEIALTSGSVVDAGTHAVQWTLPAGFGVHLAAADIDGDGMAELIAAEGWNFVWAYDVDRRLPKWSLSTPQDIGAIRVTDVDGDGAADLIVGDGQWGSLRAYDAGTLTLKWTMPNPEHGVTAILAGDVDGDGKTEVVWGAGATSTGPDHLYVVDFATKQLEWQSIHLDGPFIGPEKADVDGDGKPDIVAASWESDSGYGSGRILVFDADTFALRAISDPIVGNLSWTGLHDLRLRDVDGDGRAEIVVAADRLYDGVVEIYGFDAPGTFTLKWTNATRPFGESFNSVEAADVDGDGHLDIVAGGGREHTGAEGVFIYVYDYATRMEKWHSLQMGGYWDRITGLQIGNTDADRGPEIVGMVYGGDTYVFDGKTRVLDAIIPGPGTALRLQGLRPRIVLGDANGDIARYQHTQGSYQEIFRQNYVSGPVNGFLNAFDTTVWIGSGGSLLRATKDGAPVWQSAHYGDVFGARTLLLHGSRDFLAAGRYAIVGFRR